MTEKVHISGLYEETAGPELMSNLERIYAQGRIGHYFDMTLPRNDSRVASVLQLLQQTGWRPASRSKEWNKFEEYIYRLRREYDEGDFSVCQLLELRPVAEGHISNWHRDEQGRIQLRGLLKKGLDFGKCTFEWYVVPDRVKRLFEVNEMRHILFCETVPMAKSGDEMLELPNWSLWGRPWWELDSDFTMPPLSPVMTFVDRRGQPVRYGDYSNGFHRLDGLYNHAELHYRASDLKQLEPFDLARTAEPFGNRQGYDPFDRPLVVSKRFYDFCVANNLKADWVPVRIDHD